jgi:hypothetical protein
MYNVTKRFIQRLFALIDRGADGGVVGSDMRLMYYHKNGTRVNIGGVGDHLINGIQIGSFTAVIQKIWVTSLPGSIIILTFQSTIHSAVQLEDYKLLVSDTCIKHGGKQRIDTPDGHWIPLTFKEGLCYVKQRSPTDTELTTYPHFHYFTSETDWDPTKLDDHRTDDESMRQIPTMPIIATNDFYCQQGNYNGYKSDTNIVSDDDDNDLSDLPGLQDCTDNNDESSSGWVLSITTHLFYQM